MRSSALKILIIRFSSIGDIVLTTPVIRCLKKQLPDVEIHYLTKAAFKQVLDKNPYIDYLHFLSDPEAETISILKEIEFDLVIDLHHNFRTLKLKRKLRVPSRSFNKLNIQKWILVNFKKNLLPPVHIVDRYLETVKRLGVKNDEQGLDYFTSEDHDLAMLLPPSHQLYTALVIGAQHATKRLPQDKLISLCKMLNHPVVLLGGKEDMERGAEIAENSGLHVFNACGKFSLDESAFIVKCADKVISHDTGLMHIAAAFKKNIISVWGNTVPEFGMYPYKTAESIIFEVMGLSCRPCSKIGYSKCPQGHFKCMNEIDLVRLKDCVNA